MNTNALRYLNPIFFSYSMLRDQSGSEREKDNEKG
jgi:hypothetical protein